MVPLTVLGSKEQRMAISAVGRTSLVDEVVGQLQHQIESEGMQAGDRLPTEAELTAQLRVSRNVLREAVQRLDALGLVSVRRGQGMFVAAPDQLASCVRLIRSALAISPRDLVQFTEFRTAIELQVAEAAARCATPAQVEELETLCDRIDGEELSYEGAIELDFAFHRKLMEITGNQLTLNIMTVLHEFFLAAMVQTTPRPRDHRISRQLHRAIVRAIRDGDARAARDAMQQHMDITRQRMKLTDSPASGLES
jgi:GntR family transcriptional repressor for pyruvate dehydrogenase complex